MRTDVWWKAFVLAIIIHAAGVLLIGQGFQEAIASESEVKYLEIELIPAPSIGEMIQSGAAPQVAVNQNSKAITNTAKIHVGQVANDGVVAASDIMPGYAVGGEGVGQTSEIGGGGNGSSSSGNGMTGAVVTGSVVAVIPPRGERDVDRRPYAVYSPSPEYPSVARLNRWQGTVVISALVETSGSVADVRVAKSSGYDELDQVAEAILYRWRFNPAYREGLPVTAWIKVPVDFKLR